MKANISQQEIQQTAVRLGIPDHHFIYRRIARAFDLVATGKVSAIDDSIFRVKSQFALSACDRTRQVSYIVETNHFAPSCTCKDSQKTLFCKHQIASRLVENEQRGAIFACESQYCASTRRQSRNADTRRSRKASPVCRTSAQNTPKLTRNFDYDAEGLAQRMAPRRRIAVKETPNPKVKASWVVVEDGRTYVNVWQDLNGKICCVCGAYYKRDCIHKQAIRDYYDGGNGSKIANECGTEMAKELQDRLNGANGTGDTQSPSHHQLDTNDPFQECEQLDINQIEGRSWRVRSHALGDLVHHLSNGKYVISYKGIMSLAEQHNVGAHR